MSNSNSFSVPRSQDPAGSPIPVHSTPDLTKETLLSFPAFNVWLSTLQQSLAHQTIPSHEFHSDPYTLRSITIQSVDYFKGGRVGFLKLKADVSTANGEALPGSVFLRGGSVGMLLILHPSDTPSTDEKESLARAILTIQPRIPAASLSFPEIPAGMLDDSGSFAGGAAKEIAEETGLQISADELIDLTSLALTSFPDADGDGEALQKAVYPSPGGSDEFIPLFLCRKNMPRAEIDALQGRLTGLRAHGEKITLKVVPLSELWRVGVRDGKTLAAWALYSGLKSEGRI